MEYKDCSQCGSVKPLYEFRKCKSSSDGHRNQCKACHSKNNRERHWRLAGIRDFKLHDFDRMRDESMGSCNICGKWCGDNLHVDHDHDTGKVRGLLCSDCNLGLGKLGDNVEGLTRALNYLKDHPQ